MLPLLAPWVPRHGSTGAAGLHRNSRREAAEATRFLPGASHHWEDRHNAQYGEDDQRNQSVGNPSGAQEPHESGVSSTERLWDTYAKRSSK